MELVLIREIKHRFFRNTRQEFANECDKYYIVCVLKTSLIQQISIVPSRVRTASKFARFAVMVMKGAIL